MSSLDINSFYKKTQEDKKFNADKAWETVKFCLTFCSTLITASIGLLGVINFLVLDVIVKAILILSVLPLPFLMISTIRTLKKNFQRECNRMYRSIATLMKIEENLPKRTNLKPTNHFPKEKTLLDFPECDDNYPTTEKYIDAMMEKNNKFYLTMHPVFVILEILSWVMVGFTVGIAVVVLIPLFANFLKNLSVSLLA